MNEPKEVAAYGEVWHSVFDTYETNATTAPEGADEDSWACMITPRPIWEQRQEALRDAIAALENVSKDPTPFRREQGLGLVAHLRALPVMHDAKE